MWCSLFTILYLVLLFLTTFQRFLKTLVPSTFSGIFTSFIFIIRPAIIITNILKSPHFYYLPYKSLLSIVIFRTYHHRLKVKSIFNCITINNLFFLFNFIPKIINAVVKTKRTCVRIQLIKFQFYN